MNILVMNAGSSSLKYQLFDMESRAVLARGLCERIGLDGKIRHMPKNGKGAAEEQLPLPAHADAVKTMLAFLTDDAHGVIGSVKDIHAVGHRIVHGGEYFSESVVITEDVTRKIEACVPLAPLHNPGGLTGIRACLAVLPEVPQVAVFDTAFHQTMPPKAYLYAIPYEYYEKYKIRRYGFHGISHLYVSRRAAAMLGRPAEDVKVITCHLGNGSSVTAVRYGRVMDTSMGFTPLAGLPMGTRSGSIDPAIVAYIAEHEGKSSKEVTDILNKESGVLGVSGVSSDFRDVKIAAAAGNERAALAIDMFLYAVTKYIGFYAAAMGGVDAVAFTAGVGENDGPFREKICENLGFMGICIDPEKNGQRGKETDISAKGAAVSVFVIPTNEELVIAEDTMRLAAK